VRIILEQQVSLASAQAAYDRLAEAVSPLVPERFLKLGDAGLKTIGFSRQKTGYCRGLAEAILDGRLNLRKLGSMDDDAVRRELKMIRGIGDWTADIYLLMALRRPDIWPSGDLALVNAVKEAKGLRKNPSPKRWGRIGAAWQPWRAVAARMLWHFYLSERGRS
jgi:DNA-3-methyladenine glycosylase II